jgi:hypothetical protein
MLARDASAISFAEDARTRECKAQHHHDEIFILLNLKWSLQAHTDHSEGDKRMMADGLQNS